MTDFKKDILECIEKNLPQVQSTIVKDIINNNEKLLSENSALLKDNKNLKEQYLVIKESSDNKTAKINELEKDLKSLALEKQEVESLRVKYEQLINTAELKIINIKLEESNKRSEIMFDLVKTVFKHPTKIREFSGDVVGQTSNKNYDYNTGSPTGEYSNPAKIEISNKETESYE